MVPSSNPSDIVIARGTEDGLVLRVDGRCSYDRLALALQTFLSSRKGFLRGSKVISLEWLHDVPSGDIRASLMEEIRSSFGLHVNEILNDSEINRERNKVLSGDGVGEIFEQVAAFDNVIEEAYLEEKVVDNYADVEVVEQEDDKAGLLRVKSSSVNRTGGDHAGGAVKERRKLRFGSRSEDSDTLRRESAAKDVVNLKPVSHEEEGTITYATLRSGQIVESDHTVVVVGDVNSGAEVVSGGDVIILGNLRGVAHAGAFNEDGDSRMIFAMGFAPTQIRIGSLISRGSGESGGGVQQDFGPEFARVENGEIVVVSYSSKQAVALSHSRKSHSQKALSSRKELSRSNTKRVGSIKAS
jgi:septum site-determining protein MinC